MLVANTSTTETTAEAGRSRRCQRFQKVALLEMNRNGAHVYNSVITSTTPKLYSVTMHKEQQLGKDCGAAVSRLEAS